MNKLRTQTASPWFAQQKSPPDLVCFWKHKKTNKTCLKKVFGSGDWDASSWTLTLSEDRSVTKAQPRPLGHTQTNRLFILVADNWIIQGEQLREACCIFGLCFCEFCHHLGSRYFMQATLKNQGSAAQPILKSDSLVAQRINISCKLLTHDCIIQVKRWVTMFD